MRTQLTLRRHHSFLLNYNNCNEFLLKKPEYKDFLSCLPRSPQ